jgi:hypothetical protein
MEALMKVGRNNFEPVARGSQLSRGLSSKVASDTLRALRDAGIIEQHTPRQWQVTDPLLRNFLADLDHDD